MAILKRLFLYDAKTFCAEFFARFVRAISYPKNVEVGFEYPFYFFAGKGDDVAP